MKQLNKVSLFKDLSEAEFKELGPYLSTKSYKKKETIFSEGEPGIGFYVVDSGRVKIFKLSPDGKEQVLHIFGLGELFGEVPIFLGRAFPAHAVTLEDSTLIYFPRPAFIDLISRTPGQVCPTGAISALPLEEKRVARIGLAVVDQQTCLPYAGREACQLCVDECRLAGYDAFEFVRVGTELDAPGEPIEGSGFLAPTVRADRCVGCGLRQTRCYRINVKSKQLLTSSAVIVEAGAGNEDRLRDGSYCELRKAEQREQEAAEGQRGKEGSQHGYLPEFLK